ncbi:MAG: hypothetical protein WA160_02745 [Pseudobdellovibrio sp.]
MPNQMLLRQKRSSALYNLFNDIVKYQSAFKQSFYQKYLLKNIRKNVNAFEAFILNLEENLLKNQTSRPTQLNYNPENVHTRSTIKRKKNLAPRGRTRNERPVYENNKQLTYSISDTDGHYDIDGVSFDNNIGVIVASNAAT